MKNLKDEKIGTILTMNDGSQCKCIGYRNNKDCDFQFLDEYGVIKYHQKYVNFIRGSIKNPYAPHIANVGIVGVGEDYSTNPKAYKMWQNMLERCYKTRTNRRRDINYFNCVVCDEWLYFQNFVKWYNDNISLINIDEKICIDKDLLYKHNTVYSPKNCLLVPEKINIFLTTSKYSRGQYPIGVSYDKRSNKFKAQCCDPLDRYCRNLGRFDTPEDAFLKYKQTKEQYAKDLANYYNGMIDDKVIIALRNYVVDITD